jgi:hypothetical protein
MSPAGLYVLKRTGCTGKFKCPLKKNAAFLPRQKKFKLDRQRVNAVQFQPKMNFSRQILVENENIKFKE